MNQQAQTDLAILAAAFACLGQAGRFIQFTYGPQAPVAEEVVRSLGLHVHRGDFILRNVPPATVYVYTRAASTDDRETRPRQETRHGQGTAVR